MEDPCFGLHREAISSLGLRVAPVPVDDAGLDVARLADLNMGAERVAYAGCVSKTLTPALRLGWNALPRWLIDDVMREKLFDDMGTSMLEQVALARFIDAGALGRHLRRVRPIYRRRRDTALESLATALPDARPKGIAAGMHVYVELPAWCDESALIEAARARGLLMDGATWSGLTTPRLACGTSARGPASIPSPPPHGSRRWPAPAGRCETAPGRRHRGSGTRRG